MINCAVMLSQKSPNDLNDMKTSTKRRKKTAIMQPWEYNVIIKWYCVTKAKAGRQGKPRRSGIEKSRVNSRAAERRRNEKRKHFVDILNVGA